MARLAQQQMQPFPGQQATAGFTPANSARLQNIANQTQNALQVPGGTFFAQDNVGETSVGPIVGAGSGGGPQMSQSGLAGGTSGDATTTTTGSSTNVNESTTTGMTTSTGTTTTTGETSTSGQTVSEWLPSDKPQPFRESTKFTAPQWNEQEVTSKQQAFASPAIRRLQDQVRRAQQAASYADNPMVKSETIRQALSGYGQGLENVMAGAYGQALTAYNQEYSRKFEEKKINFDAVERNKDQNFQAAMNAWMKGGKQVTSTDQTTSQTTATTSTQATTSDQTSKSTQTSDQTQTTTRSQPGSSSAGDGAGAGSPYAGLSLSQALDLAVNKSGKKSGSLESMEVSNWNARTPVYEAFGITGEARELRDPNPALNRSPKPRGSAH